MNAARDAAVIGQRIIDCCLREDLRGLLSRGRVQPLPRALASHWPQPADGHWLHIAHLGAGELWLPVRRGAPLQAWSACGDAWLWRQAGRVEPEQGYRRWLEHLGQGLDADSLALFAAYRDEADCAAQHRSLCRAAQRRHGPALARVLEEPDWGRRLLGIDRLASYLDHPFYPTARAKSGFDAAALAAYAPEFGPRFRLNWLAVPRAELHLSSPPPALWPRFAEVGLDPDLAASHALLPVHPLTWAQLQRHGLPAGAHQAPSSALEVEPTLSVRTLMCVAQPELHIKLPLLVSTLGARNLRLIKPSTLYDGHWFQTCLQALAGRDAALGARYLHVDEQHGGHAAEQRHLAYLVRRYPAGLEDCTLVPVAALASPQADGRLFVAQLVERFHGGDLQRWWQDYLELLLQVHLRLWLGYGIALEANQQNAVLIFQAGRPLRLLMKDNDAARLWPARFAAACPDLAQCPDALRDERIRVDGWRALAEMFCTITLQLNIVAPLEAIADAGLAPRAALYAELRARLHACLAQLEDEGLDTAEARCFLLDSPQLPVKYLLSAGSLLSKAQSGAADINKFYGYSAANFLLEDGPCSAD
ncbi:IucA/IucC family siderophore biosynthesis protein [Pseudomonas lalucatii]|uniref:IucA/IucC family siderophore biosynthesis protein n=1 Tax=Pseudomonas lalucatii TaxID=1424203 RepID=A0ABS5PZ44_9PSED|nr:IucA/IucC family protein [Pseudomonas lalucatii]MBS7661742.1 IucA/IucC family siderophore biosynthesis protein [Pseudomonas lalucatii]QVM88118.1 IucA/IucC family siderophore biosynthesis protein [Pseudomonas lalucatii]